MADVQQLVVGAIGGFLGKYIIDRLTESHKAAVSLASKRKDRYHEKQAAAITGTYERLARYVSATFAIYMTEPHPAEWQIAKLKEDADKATKAGDEFMEFFTSNVIYFPSQLAEKINEFYGRLFVILVRYRIMSHDEPSTTEDDTLANIIASRKSSQVILSQLQDDFRELMLRDDPSWSSLAWERLRAITSHKAIPPTA